MTHYVVIDFETASACDLPEAGAWRYAEDPTTEVICLAVREQGRPPWVWVPGPERAIGGKLETLAADPEVEFVAHNAMFEQAIWQRQMVEVYGFPPIPRERWHCTLASAAMHTLPQQLDRLATVLGLDRRDDAAAKKKRVVGLSRPNKAGAYDRRPATLAAVYADAGRDVQEEVDVLKAIGLLPLGERKVWLFDQQMNERGVRLDLDYIAACERLVEKASVPMLWEFRNLTKDAAIPANQKEFCWGLKPSQGQRVIDWARAKGAFIPDLTKETVSKLLGTHEEDDYESLACPGDTNPYQAVLPPDVRRALEIRAVLASSSIKKLPRMRTCVCSDGRARGLLQYHGTMPGRKAGRLFQPQNFPRPTLDNMDGKGVPIDLVVSAIMSGDPDLVAATVGPPIQTVVSGLRHTIIADRGRVLASGDYAGIQARIVLALAGQHDKTALMASGADVYCDMATLIYKRPIDKKRDPAERQTGKNSVLGLGFQMGWKKFRDKYAAEQSEEFCQGVVDTYRLQWAPKVPKLWEALGQAALLTVQTGQPHTGFGITYALHTRHGFRWLTARLPSGRLLWYPNPEMVRRAMPWDPFDIRLGWTYQAVKNGVWRTIHAFGGLLTENVVMGIERDILCHGAELLEANGYPMILDVHDENLTEPLAADCDIKAVEQIMCDVEPWVSALGIPIAVECWVGDRYRK